MEQPPRSCDQKAAPELKACNYVPDGLSVLTALLSPTQLRDLGNHTPTLLTFTEEGSPGSAKDLWFQIPSQETIFPSEPRASFGPQQRALASAPIAALTKVSLLRGKKAGVN